MTSDIWKFDEALRKLAPGISLDIDPADDPKGESFLDLSAPGLRLVVSYRPEQGFGFFAGEAGFGQRPTEFDRSPEMAALKALTEGTAARAGSDRG